MLTHATAAQLDPAPHAPAARLAFLDDLRGLAALAVFVAHSIQIGFAYYEPPFRWFDLGQFGVVLFFLCSGFIIPMSLERAPARSGPLRSFWVRRVCRLYPLYWLSIALVLLSYAIGWEERSPYINSGSPAAIIANLTMLQGLFGQPHLLTVYWTLFFELLFYGVVSLLFALGTHMHTVRHTVALLLLTIFTQLILPLTIGLHFPISFLSNLAVMFVGTALCRYHQREISGRTAWQVVLLMLAMLLATGWESPAALAARVTALAIFGAGLLLSDRPQPGSLLYRGRISYSFYLLHPFVLTAIQPLPSYSASLLVWSVVTIALAAATYRWVEQPGIALGRRLTRTSAATPVHVDKLLGSRDDMLPAAAQGD